MLPRLVGISGVDNDRDEGALEDGDSWAEYNNKKAKQCSEYLGGDSLLGQIGCAVIASEPLDRLSNRLQHLDEVGNVLFDILGPGNGCLGDCQRHLYLLLHRHLPAPANDRTSWPVSLLIEYADESECEGMLDDMLASVAFLSSQVWARLEVPNCTAERRLLLAHQGDMRPVREFYRVPKCCLTEQFGEPLRTRFEEDDWLWPRPSGSNRVCKGRRSRRRRRRRRRRRMGEEE